MEDGPEFYKYITGPVEAGLYVLGCAVGAYIGFKFGSEFVELAKQVQNPNTIEAFVTNHPIIIKTSSCVVGTEFIGTLARLPGKLTDKLMGTYHKYQK
jgi:hypothetical protein|tara:strand:- start:865 stop:1158 length:294 start_codon:yes stop_codon:yes gene_type:complete